jgi:hypothetical protein
VGDETLRATDREHVKRSWPAGTGVWVVHTVCLATCRAASSKGSP